MTERLTWEEIKARYPHQNVGLVDCEPEASNFRTARVKYTERDISRKEMLQKVFDGEIYMVYTNPEEIIHVPTPFSLRFSDGTVI